jgi:hypothetical protein
MKTSQLFRLEEAVGLNNHWLRVSDPRAAAFTTDEVSDGQHTHSLSLLAAETPGMEGQ